MSLPSGTHDKRTFRHFAKMAADGSVAATIEVADGQPDPVDGEGHVYVEVTELYPYDLSAVKVKPKDISDLKRQDAKDRDVSALRAALKAGDTGHPRKGPRG